MSFEFTEKMEATLAAATQLAKASAHDEVEPLHFASVMLTEDTDPVPPGSMPKPPGTIALFVQAIQKAGGDQVSIITAISSYVLI
jgi:hypothetical protein